MLAGCRGAALTKIFWSVRRVSAVLQKNILSRAFCHRHKVAVLQNISCPSLGICGICFSVTRTVQRFRRRILRIFEGALSSFSPKGEKRAKKHRLDERCFLSSKASKKGQDMFCITAITMAAIQNPWSGHSPDTPEPTAGHWANAAE